MNWLLIIMGCLIFDEIRDNQKIGRNYVEIDENDSKIATKCTVFTNKKPICKRRKKYKAEKMRRQNQIFEAELLCLGEKALQRNKV